LAYKPQNGWFQTNLTPHQVPVIQSISTGIQLGEVCASNLLMSQGGIEEQGYTENADTVHVCRLHVLQIYPFPTIKT